MRKIIHIDADAFYASVEERDNPDLKQHPIAVGGNPNGRGVVATCNYLARDFGVRSAMSSAKALTLCPSLIFIKPRFPAYREASQKMHEIFREYTDLIEPLSLDEAYLDVSNSNQYQGSATRIAEAIQAEIRARLNLTVSAGVAPNKFLAKVASDWRKPAGLFVVEPSHVEDFVKALPVKKINGVGRVTAQKMRLLGIETCDDLQQIPELELIRHFGKYGTRLSELSHGRDERPVNTERQRKSLSVETTFEQDLLLSKELDAVLDKLFLELKNRSAKLKRTESVSGRFVKLKFKDFTQTTLEESLHSGIEDWADHNAFISMLQKAWQRKQIPVRLIGLGLRIGNNKKDKHQLDLFSDPSSGCVQPDTDT